MHLEVSDGLVGLGLILAIATMLVIAPALRVPYPILLVIGASCPRRGHRPQGGPSLGRPAAGADAGHSQVTSTAYSTRNSIATIVSARNGANGIQ